MNNNQYTIYYIQGRYDWKRNAFPATVRFIKEAIRKTHFTILYIRYVLRYKHLPDLG